MPQLIKIDYRVKSQLSHLKLAFKMRKTSVKNTYDAGVKITIFLIVVFYFNQVACAIVLHPDHEPPVNWNDHPPQQVVGRWSTNASCVAIAPNYIITTIHQNGGVGSTVTIASGTYTVDKIWTMAPVESGQVPDIRIARLANANLTHYVSVYNKTDEVGQNIVIGGYGKTRGAELSDDNIVYGYEWAGSSNVNFRWCTNSIDNSIEDASVESTYFGDLIYGDFDIPYIDPNSPGTIYEGIVAEYDSGGGWFIQDDEGQWHVAGLSNLVSHNYSQFLSPEQPHQPSPSQFYAMRVSHYETWIQVTLAAQKTDTSGDINDDGIVDLLDFQILSSQLFNQGLNHADLNNDNIVDIFDLQCLCQFWLEED